jgi:hypothetical protein
MAKTGSADGANIRKIAPVSRRQFATIGSAALFAGSTGIAFGKDLPVTETAAAIATPAGDRSGYFIKPEAGAYPALAIWAHSAAELTRYRAAARSLAAQGHAVLVVEAPAGAEPQSLNRASKAVATWLAGQSEAVGTEDDFSLHSFSGAHGRISLASRDERRAAVQNGVLVTLPKSMARAPGNRDMFAQLARGVAGRLAA